jgi:hypothetical protein
MMYASILQFHWMLNVACGRSSDGENWTVAEIVAENQIFPMLVSRSRKWQFWTHSEEQYAALLTYEVNSSKNDF